MKNLDNPTILQKRLNDSEEDNLFDIQEDLFSLTVLQNLFENGNINNNLLCLLINFLQTCVFFIYYYRYYWYKDY